MKTTLFAIRKCYLFRIVLPFISIAILASLTIPCHDFIVKCDMLDRTLVVTSLIFSSLIGLSGFLNNKKIYNLLNVYILAMLICVALYFFISLLNNFSSDQKSNSLLNYLIVFDFVWSFYISFTIIFDLYRLKININNV